MENKIIEVGKAYFNISNGGVDFSVEDGEFGPILNVVSRHFGHLTNCIGLNTTKESLKNLGEMLIKASEYNFTNPDYVYAARCDTECKPSCKGECGSEECHDNYQDFLSLE